MLATRICARVTPAGEAAAPRVLPGDLAMWLFILAELSVFALFFLGFAVARRLEPEVFIAGQSSLHTGAGLLNTVALITSSYLVVRAVLAIRRDRARACAAWLAAAMAAAAVYLVAKLWEYEQLLAAGHDLDSDTFFTLYFLLTFFHFLHVLMGMVILAAVALKALRGGYDAHEHAGVETGASYWHMVDLVWLILFPLVYVIR